MFALAACKTLAQSFLKSLARKCADRYQQSSVSVYSSHCRKNQQRAASIRHLLNTSASASNLAMRYLALLVVATAHAADVCSNTQAIDGQQFPDWIKSGGSTRQLTGGGTRYKYGVAKVRRGVLTSASRRRRASSLSEQGKTGSGSRRSTRSACTSTKALRAARSRSLLARTASSSPPTRNSTTP